MKDCGESEREQAFFEAVIDPRFSHTRARSWRADGWVKDDSDYIVTVYRRDPESPTGVVASANIDGLQRAAAILDRAGRPFPMSPTEGLKRHDR